mmetsp:Transcript_20304/g.48308  ORF Transcript_20304/g.48308 Transcript_20304/m.48308 type:complete len:88 (+) Transcript_20304:624-887(+)
MRRDDKQYTIQFSMDGWVQYDDILHVDSFHTVRSRMLLCVRFSSLGVELSDLSSRHELNLYWTGGGTLCYGISSMATTTTPSSNSMV